MAKAIVAADLYALDGIAGPALREEGRTWVRKNIFSPFRIARVVDLHGGLLILAAIELLRTLETNVIKYKRAILPCSYDIKRVFTRLERIGNFLAPYVLSFEDGETVKFDYDAVLLHIIDTYGLGKIASWLD